MGKIFCNYNLSHVLHGYEAVSTNGPVYGSRILIFELDEGNLRIALSIYVPRQEESKKKKKSHWLFI